MQWHHDGRKRDAAAKARADKILDECLDSITAFLAITELERAATATPDDYARFQREAITCPKNWRTKHPRSKETHEADRWPRTLG